MRSCSARRGLAQEMALGVTRTLGVGTMKSALQAPHKQAPASYWTYLYARSHDASAGGGGVVLSSDGVGSSRSACPDFAAVTLALGLRGRPQHWRPDVLLYRRLRPVGALGQLRRGRVIHLLRRIQRTGTPCSCMTSPPWDRWAIGSALAAGLIALYFVAWRPVRALLTEHVAFSLLTSIETERRTGLI